MRTAIVGCCDVQVVKAGGFNQMLSLETGRRGYVCALHMDEWEGRRKKRLQAIVHHTSGLALESNV